MGQTMVIFFCYLIALELFEHYISCITLYISIDTHNILLKLFTCYADV